MQDYACVIQVGSVHPTADCEICQQPRLDHFCITIPSVSGSRWFTDATLL